MENKYVKQYQAQLARVTDEEEKGYLLTRVFPQMAFYSAGSRRCKQRYQLFALLSIIFNGVIPVLMLLTELTGLELIVRLAVAALSAGAGILTAISGMKNYRELWIQYRVSLELMKLMVDRYFLRVGDLGSDDPAVRHEALQRQCEAIMAEESRQWRELLTEAKKQG